MIRIFVLAAIYCLSSAAFACPDFSGHYAMVFGKDDYRKESLWNVTQNGCASYSATSQVTFKNSAPSPVEGPYTRVIDGTKEYWDGDALMDFQRDANSEHCDIRGKLEKDTVGNLRYSWRFECPAPLGTGPWYTPETTEGWTGELYLKR